MPPQPVLTLSDVVRKLVVLFAVCLVFLPAKSYGQLQAYFNSDKEGGCPPFIIQFNSYTSGASANAVYKWDFGNGNSSELQSPSAIFTEEKTYKVTLTVTDAGKTSSYSANITGFKKPVADFSVLSNTVCLPAMAELVSNSTATNGTIVDYYWDFGDGSTARGYSANITHAYTTLLKPTINLTVTNSYGCNATVEKRDLIKTLPSMQASFTASKEVLCKATDAVSFTNTSSGPGTLSYTWSFGDGQTSTAQHPSHAFNKKGIYTVSMTVKNTEGCSVTSTRADLLNVASYKASFNAQQLICKDQGASFYPTSSPTPSSYSWYVDNQAAYSWYGELSYNFPDTGKHTIKLVNTFGNCPDTATATVFVKPVPQPLGFVAELQSACGAPTVVKFKDTTKAAVKWNWTFDDYGSSPTSTLQAPSYTYSSNGGRSVYLTVTNAEGCSNSTGRYINITQPDAYIINKLDFSEENWRCGYTKVQMVANPNNADTIASYKWNFGDGTSSTLADPVHEYTKPGNYTVSLEYTLKNGCKGVASGQTFTVYQKPKADFAVSPGTTICGNTPVRYNYTGGSAFTNLNWSLEGEYNYFHYGLSTQYGAQYQAEGVYGVGLTVYNGNCWDTITKPRYVTVKLPFPRIVKDYQTTCDGTRGKVVLSQVSVGATAIKWDFGDGKTQSFNSSEPMVEHEYTKTGTYKVVLIATNGQCDVRDSIFVSVLLRQKPTLTLSPSTICANEITQFTASGYEQNPAPNASYGGYYIKRWEYADGAEFKGYYNNVIGNTYQYWITSGRGTLTSYQPNDSKIRLITTSSAFECEDTTTYATITFRGATPGFEIAKDSVCYNTGEVLFKDVSTAPNNSISRWDWNFGDGQTLSRTTGGQVSHKYNTPGSYNVTLTITDAGGCSSSTQGYSKMVVVRGPQVSFAISQGNNVPLNTTVTLNNYTNAYGVENPLYEWDFGDGSPVSNDYWPSHNYPNPGTYIIRLKATDPATGCTSQTQQTLVVRYFNWAFQFHKSFITASQCAPAVVNFQNTSYGYTKIIWDFGDGSDLLENIEFPSHVYKEAGEYIVVLSVFGYNGLKGQYRDTINILKPKASLAAAPGEICIGQQVQLHASGAGLAGYIWDMGNGVIVSSTDSSRTYQYPGPGVFKPQLLVKDVNGCTQAADANDWVKVRPEPVLTITPPQNRICLGEQVQLTANATNAVKYIWSAANGITQLNIANPTVKPTIHTEYTVKAEDDIGCTIEGKVMVNVVQPEFLKVPADTGICFGEQVKLVASGVSKYEWINNTVGLSNTNIADPVAKPLVNTTYTVTGGDLYGCFPTTKDIRIAVYDLPWVKAPEGREIIAGTPIQLNPQNSTDVIEWRWTPATYLDCPVCPLPTAKPLANTNYKITVTNGNGCTASDNVLIKMQCDVDKVFIPNAFTPDGDGKNDVFGILGISYVKHMVIFNRYGRKVYERSNFLAADKSLAWDGSINGVPQQPDTYVYYVEMECETGGVFTRKGTVTLIR